MTLQRISTPQASSLRFGAKTTRKAGLKRQICTAVLRILYGQLACTLWHNNKPQRADGTFVGFFVASLADHTTQRWANRVRLSPRRPRWPLCHSSHVHLQTNQCRTNQQCREIFPRACWWNPNTFPPKILSLPGLPMSIYNHLSLASTTTLSFKRFAPACNFLFLLITSFAIVNLGKATCTAAEPSCRVGVIGLDTSHVIAFTKAFQQAKPDDPDLAGFDVVAAYPFGSADIESSASRIPKYTEDMKALGVEIVESIEILLQKVDCVLLETNDGRLHLEQALQVFRAGKPVFIDKPTGSNLAEVVAIFRAAAHYEVPMFSSSSLRYSDGAQAIRNGKVGRVLGCSTYSPCSLEPTHVDLFWYGIHGVESLYTCMGTGCQTVTHTSTKDFELAVGAWADGRIGTFRGIRAGSKGYGGLAFGEKGITELGPYGGYRPLVVQIARFFRSAKPPIAAEETVELYAFMQAALKSKEQGGAPVAMQQVMDEANQAADELLGNELNQK